MYGLSAQMGNVEGSELVGAHLGELRLEARKLPSSFSEPRGQGYLLSNSMAVRMTQDSESGNPKIRSGTLIEERRDLRLGWWAQPSLVIHERLIVADEKALAGWGRWSGVEG